MLNDGNERSMLLALSNGIIKENGRLRTNFIYNGSKLTKAMNFFDVLGSRAASMPQK